MLDEVILTNRFPLHRVERTMIVGMKIIHTEVIQISEYPIFPIVGLSNRNPYPVSDVRLVRPIQESINKTHSKLLAYVASVTNVKVLLPEGSMDPESVEEKMSMAGTAVMFFNPEFGQPVVLAPAALPSAAWAQIDRDIALIERILGVYVSQQGDSSSTPDTYRATIAIDEFASRRIKKKMDDIETALTMMGKVVIELVQANYTEEKAIRIFEPNDQVRVETLNEPLYDEFGHLQGRLNDVTVGRYDLIVVTGSTLPSNRWAELEMHKEMFQVGAIDDVELLKKTELYDVEGVLKRKGVLQQQAQLIEQLQQQIKELTGDLQTSDREGVSSRKRTEVEKTKTQLNRIVSSLKAKAEVATNNLSG